MISNDMHKALRQRVLTLDGAMGTMLQKARAEAGCIDLLCLSSPETIEDIHMQYLQAGADIITTDTFNANAISLARYDAAHLVTDICREAVAAARRAVGRSGRQAWIAGDVGPTGISLSMTAEESDVDFDTLRGAYREQIGALAEAGADLILLETIFDTLNAKAAISALLEVRASTGLELPLMVSATLTESGRLLSGQTLEEPNRPSSSCRRSSICHAPSASTPMPACPTRWGAIPQRRPTWPRHCAYPFLRECSTSWEAAAAQPRPISGLSLPRRHERSHAPYQHMILRLRCGLPVWRL